MEKQVAEMKEEARVAEAKEESVESVAVMVVGIGHRSLCSRCRDHNTLR